MLMLMHSNTLLIEGLTLRLLNPSSNDKNEYISPAIKYLTALSKILTL